MKNIFLPLAFIFGLVAGFVLRPGDAEQAQQSSTPQLLSNAEVETLRNKLQKWHDTDFLEYQKLKDQKAKYMKANDLLAKMMMVFLADLGLRISKEEIKELAKESYSPPDFSGSENSDASPGRNQCPKMQVDVSCPSLAELAEQQGKTLVPKKRSDKEWQKKEKKLAEISSEADINDFLKNVEIPNFFDEIRSAKLVGPRMAQNIQGTYEGTLIYDSAEVANSEIKMILKGEYVEGKLVGDNKIILSREGKPFSNSTGDGHLKNYKEIDGSNNSLFIDLGGNSGYLQVYFLSSNSEAIANFYLPKGVGEFVKAGTARLYRK